MRIDPSPGTKIAKLHIVPAHRIDRFRRRERGVSSDALPEFEAAVSAKIPLGRFGEAEELASAALFLASSESRFVTGVNLAVDGGLLFT